MKTCNHCGGLKATEDREMIAGTLCSCSFGLASCSLPASSVHRLLAKWQAHVDDSNWNAHYRSAWQNCIDDLRAELEAASARQPE